MPKIHKVKCYAKLLEKIAINDLFLLETFGKNDARGREDEILEDLTLALALVEYEPDTLLVNNSVPKTHKFLTEVLPNLDENGFRQIFRVSWTNFKYILELIKTDESFNGPRSCRQHPVEMQLMIVLYRLGASGASVAKISNFFGIGDGGTVQITTERIFKAILKLKNKFLHWPDEIERNTMVAETFRELPHCIGYIGGLEIKLAEKPYEDPEAYFSERHSTYTLTALAVCDYKLRIREMEVAYPGGMSEARIYNNCDLSIKPQEFMQGAEWIAGSNAYKLTETILTPFSDTSMECTFQQRTDFNRNLNKYRGRINDCLGLLKERFNSLKELKIQIKSDQSIELACRWILVCAILQNIVLHRGEPADVFEISEAQIDDQENEDPEVKYKPTAEGLAKRRELIEIKQEL